MSDVNNSSLSESDSRQYASFAHLGGILLGFLAPLILFLMYKDKDEFVKQEATEALNFQITLFIIYVVGSILSLIIIGLVVVFAAWVVSIIFSIMGFMKAKEGTAYRYPINIRIIK